MKHNNTVMLPIRGIGLEVDSSSLSCGITHEEVRQMIQEALIAERGVGVGFPDYSKRQTSVLEPSSLPFSYTATEDCWIIAGIAYESSGCYFVKVDGVSVGIFTPYSNLVSYSPIPVCKGSEVILESDSGTVVTAYFSVVSIVNGREDKTEDVVQHDQECAAE